MAVSVFAAVRSADGLAADATTGEGRLGWLSPSPDDDVTAGDRHFCRLTPDAEPRVLPKSERKLNVSHG